jgi:hypothetical protein
MTDLPQPHDVSDGTFLAISPRTFYSLQLNRTSLPDCPEESVKCSHSYSLKWLWDNECQANFVCSRLEGNVCGDYGVGVAFGDQQEADVCYAKEVHSGRLEFYSVAEISIWYLDAADDFLIDCHFWCAGNGSNFEGVDTAEGNTTIDDKALAELVRPLRLSIWNKYLLWQFLARLMRRTR